MNKTQQQKTADWGLWKDVTILAAKGFRFPPKQALSIGLCARISIARAPWSSLSSLLEVQAVLLPLCLLPVPMLTVAHLLHRV